MPSQPQVNLEPTGEPGSANRVLRVVATLVLVALIIAGSAWLFGRVRHRQDYNRMTTVPPTAAGQPVTQR